jgi:hypothetical protein
LAAGTNYDLSRRQLLISRNGRKSWNVYARPLHAYVWQEGRFENDLELWRGLLSDPGNVITVKRATCLRFNLLTEEDFSQFRDQLDGNLAKVKWLK